MTDTTSQSATAEFREGGERRLAVLFDAEEGLTKDGRDRLTSHLLGGLACYVDDVTWTALVTAAAADAEKAGR